MTTAAQNLRNKIIDKSAIIGIIGLGYVGLPLVKCFVDAGYHVIGFDTDHIKIDSLHRGECPFPHLGEDFLSGMSDKFSPTIHMQRLVSCDVVIICVPTPLGPHGEPDLSSIDRSFQAIADTTSKRILVVLESTSYPGTTMEMSDKYRCKDCFYAFSPEREDPGRKDTSTVNIPKLVGGCDLLSGELATLLYSQAFDKVIQVSSAEVAEAAKILENTYRAVNIALVNELKVVFGAMGIDIWEVIEAAKTKPFGFQAFYPGPGVGGHCIPIDPHYLTWRAREYGQYPAMIEMAGQINRSMPQRVVDATVKALLEIKDKDKWEGHAKVTHLVLLLGYSYKANIGDCRESPSILVKLGLQSLGIAVEVNDPYIQVVEQSFDISQYNAVIICTPHDCFNPQQIADNAKIVIDTCNFLRDVTGPRGHIIKA